MSYFTLFVCILIPCSLIDILPIRTSQCGLAAFHVSNGHMFYHIEKCSSRARTEPNIKCFSTTFQ